MPRPTVHLHKIMPAAIQPNIGLDHSARQAVVEILNLLLADEAVLLLKIQSEDEQAGGTGAFDLHSIYGAQSIQIGGISSEIVERIQILGSRHINHPEELIGSARLDGSLRMVPGILVILADHEAFIRFLREDAQKCNEDYEDQGTFALLVSIMLRHEKMAWTLRSYIENKAAH